MDTETLLQLLMIFNDYEVPLTMTAGDVRRILMEQMDKGTRQYPDDVPSPTREPLAFNEYLLLHNEVLWVSEHWILIANSYIEHQAVMFAKRNVRYIHQLKQKELADMADILKEFKGKKMYINSEKDKSIKNRLHIHIKIS